MKVLSTDQIISKVYLENNDIDEQTNIFENNISSYESDDLLDTSDVIIVLSIIKQIIIFIWFDS
jgi:hypothetical protein